MRILWTRKGACNKKCYTLKENPRGLRGRPAEPRATAKVTRPLGETGVLLGKADIGFQRVDGLEPVLETGALGVLARLQRRLLPGGPWEAAVGALTLCPNSEVRPDSMQVPPCTRGLDPGRASDS